MKLTILVLTAVLAACGGSLSDEQRKQMRKKMEENKIVRVTEVEITEAAYAEGREIVETLDSLSADSTALDSFLNKYAGKIRFIRPDASNARLLEKQLIDAYLADPSGSFQDNVQKLRTAGDDFDSMLYTKPMVRKLADGSDELLGVWNIWLAKKELVMEITREK